MGCERTDVAKAKWVGRRQLIAVRIEILLFDTSVANDRQQPALQIIFKIPVLQIIYNNPTIAKFLRDMGDICI